MPEINLPVHSNVQPLVNDKAKLLYVYDPMCAWCWGFRPTWLRLKQALEGVVDVKYIVGGLAPDSEQAMPEDMQQFIQQNWLRISQQLGTEFNFDFWRNCQPRRSTYPACRAVLVARKYNAEQAMYLAIQQAYYLNAKNPSDIDILTELAGDIGLDKTTFLTELTSDEIQSALLSEIEQARSLPINGFPSLVLHVEGDVYPIAINYHNWQTTANEINGILSKGKV